MTHRYRNLLSVLLPVLSLGLLLAAGSADAQVFKWIGADGKTNYSDVPPPPSARPAQKKSFAGNVLDSADLPFSVAQAAKSSPVTLYTTANCPPCDEGRTLLNARGIPFIEKTVSSNADLAALGAGSADMPQLTVGSNRLRGFESGAWQSGLTAAGYPESNQLPKTYRNPAPQPAAGVAAVPAAAASAAEPGAAAARPAAAPRKRPAPRETPRQSEDNPAGLRF